MLGNQMHASNHECGEQVGFAFRIVLFDVLLELGAHVLATHVWRIADDCCVGAAQVACLFEDAVAAFDEVRCIQCRRLRLVDVVADRGKHRVGLDEGAEDVRVGVRVPDLGWQRDVIQFVELIGFRFGELELPDLFDMRLHLLAEEAA